MARKEVPSSQAADRNVDDYIERFPKSVQSILQEIRITIRKAAPGAEETISYQMPAFMFNGVLVYFAAYKRHIGLYPRTTAIAKFKEELAAYEGAKGSAKFPLDKPIPYGLIGRIVKFRAKENLERVKARKKKR